jgi:hypothetical protein
MATVQASVVPMEADGTAAGQVTPDASDVMDADDVAEPSTAPAQPQTPNGQVIVSPGSELPVAAVTASPALAMFSQQAIYTPMRLDMKERRYFQLLEATLSVSEYTDKVDILTWKRKDGRVVQQVKDICSILSGLVVAQVKHLV